MADDRQQDNMKEAEAPQEGGQRIAKLLARAGVGSRRAVERMIAAGMVKQHGQVITTPATLVTSVEGITVDGMAVKDPEPTRLWRYHKPAGRMTTYYDPEGRPTVFEALPENMPRVLAVGRLDLNTEGLLLLTNDGALARFLELPATGWVRSYKVRCHGYFDRDKLAEIRRGVTLEGVAYRGVQITINENREKSNIWLEISLTEGKNREVRKLLEYIGLQVTRLIRLSYGPFTLDTLDRGAIREVSPKDLHQQAAAFFKDAKITGSAATNPTEKPAQKPQNKAGWAKPKPKVNARRANKKRTDPKRKPRTGDKES